MEVKVKVFIVDNLFYLVWVIGYFLGGVMVFLVSVWFSYYKVVFCKNIILYMFGMFWVGNYDYVLEYDWLVSNSWRVVNYDDVVFYFLSLLFLSIVNGFYYYGVEVFYSKLVISVYFEYRECYGKLYNEDMICSFLEMLLYFFKWY